jgi:hypothetical protein
MQMIVIHEDDNQIIRWNGRSLQLESKESGVVGVMEVDGPNILLGSPNRMELINIQGNVVVNCFAEEAPEDDSL